MGAHARLTRKSGTLREPPDECFAGRRTFPCARRMTPESCRRLRSSSHSENSSSTATARCVRSASGGSGSVWLARDERTGLDVALKIVPREGKRAPRAAREAEAAARLRHERCVRAYDFGGDDGHVYIAYEYVPGRTLRDALRNGALTTASGRGGGAGSRRLAHAHARGIVHRDVKPSNVLLEESETISVKLLDFGLAQFDEADTLTAVGDVPGTLAYIAPERLTGEEASPASDVWAVGVMLWEALAGRHPFWGVPLPQVARRSRPAHPRFSQSARIIAQAAACGRGEARSRSSPPSARGHPSSRRKLREALAAPRREPRRADAHVAAAAPAEAGAPVQPPSRSRRARCPSGLAGLARVAGGSLLPFWTPGLLALLTIAAAAAAVAPPPRSVSPSLSWRLCSRSATRPRARPSRTRHRGRAPRAWLARPARRSCVRGRAAAGTDRRTCARPARSATRARLAAPQHPGGAGRTRRRARGRAARRLAAARSDARIGDLGIRAHTSSRHRAVRQSGRRSAISPRSRRGARRRDRRRIAARCARSRGRARDRRALRRRSGDDPALGPRAASDVDRARRLVALRRPDARTRSLDSIAEEAVPRMRRPVSIPASMRIPVVRVGREITLSSAPVDREQDRRPVRGRFRPRLPDERPADRARALAHEGDGPCTGRCPSHGSTSQRVHGLSRAVRPGAVLIVRGLADRRVAGVPGRARAPRGLRVADAAEGDSRHGSRPGHGRIGGLRARRTAARRSRADRVPPPAAAPPPITPPRPRSHRPNSSPAEPSSR